MVFLEKIINSDMYFSKIKKYKNIVLFGAGAKGKQTVEILRNKQIFPKVFIDNNSFAWGSICSGLPVISYTELTEKYEDYCILITCVYKSALSIYEMLKQKGEKNPIIFMCNPFKAENHFLTMEEIEAQKEQLEISYEALGDERSKDIFTHFLNYKITGDIFPIVKFTEGNWLEFFACDLLPIKENYTYIDIGAFTGDSIIRFLSFCKGKYEKIIGYEPDKVNFSIAKSVIEQCRIERTELQNVGLWMEPGKKEFYTTGYAYESSNFFRDTTNTTSVNIANCSTAEVVQVDILDQQSIEPTENMIIKIDALASEVPILYGSSQLIKKYKPIIIMEYGTHSKYMAETIPYLLSLNYNYNFYLRQMSTFNNSRTILYVL